MMAGRFLKSKYAGVVVTGLLGMVFYLCMGNQWISLEDDSIFYMQPSTHEGVMPIYPLFIYGMRRLLGDAAYLSGVVVIQSLAAVLCTMFFTLFLKKIFSMRLWETILLYVACMLPFSIYLPESLITHQIMTEGLSYALFYVYFALLMNYVITGKQWRCFFCVLLCVVMGLLRSQLLFLLMITWLAFLYTMVVRHKKSRMIHRILSVIVSAICGGAMVLGMIWLIYGLYGFYITHQLPAMIKYDIVQNDSEMLSEEPADKIPEAVSEDGGQHTVNTVSQFTSLLIIRGFYEADEEDIRLFDNPEIREIFSQVFEKVDEQQHRYVYARRDLYMWKDLVRDQIANVAHGAIQSYLTDHPESMLQPDDIIRELGGKVLLSHFDRYVYHSFRVMISSLISSIFFQIEPIYFLCHIITLLLYAVAIGGSIFCIRKKRNVNTVLFMSCTMVFILTMTVVINFLFMGLQRYVVYAMGIFYCSLFLLIREIFLWLCETYPDCKQLIGIKRILWK